MFKDKAILVTGAGGSIGSALCRKISLQNPKQLILFELNEYALYLIDQDLNCERLAVLGNVLDLDRLKEFSKDVDFVFHCAAYKHVPMCEGINKEYAYRNNCIGTENVMLAFKAAKNIVLLSTDKAIKPISTMGFTKEESERIAIRYGRTVVRLGNILESSGSVIPKFRNQISNGGPVTVTDPETTRYFILMSEAVDFLISSLNKFPG